MKTTLTLIVVMAFTLLIPQKSHALSCVAAAYNMSIAQGNLNLATEYNLPTLYFRIAVDEARGQLQICQYVETIDFE